MVREYEIEGRTVWLCAVNGKNRCYWKYRNALRYGDIASNYRQTLSRAAEESRVESILVATARSGPFIRGSKEWEQRERARAALGCGCLSFGAVDDSA